MANPNKYVKISMPSKGINIFRRRSLKPDCVDLFVKVNKVFHLIETIPNKTFTMTYTGKRLLPKAKRLVRELKC